ncbi:prepilin-type N-terminal cleavage/methylation domain-containing protein [Candidatus Azambacteria bacterium]|nr:prepilin-type N-terminal cleavage/methylation domain-containing protein [Candidatus Azambacteria bacterium]
MKKNILKSNRPLKAISHKLQADEGYSLVELLMAIGIFAIVIGINTNIFINTIKAQRKAVEIQNVTDSTRYVMEIMTREIRTMDLTLTQSATCSLAFCMKANGDNGAEFSFVSGSENRSGMVLKFSFLNNAVYFNDDAVNTPGGDMTITPSNIKVTAVNFKVSNLSVYSQPRITVTLKAESANPVFGQFESIVLHSTISPRQLNL